MRKFLFFLFFTSFLSCASGTSDDDFYCSKTKDLTTNNNVNHNIADNYGFIVLIDNSFSQEHKEIIINSFDQWKQVLGERITYKMILEKHQNLTDAQEDGKIKFINEIPPKGTSGYCWWEQTSNDGISTSAVIHVSNSLGPNDIFSAVALHEIGHSLNLDHYEGKHSSVMYPGARSAKDYYITCLDKANVCEMWKCNVNCE